MKIIAIKTAFSLQVHFHIYCVFTGSKSGLNETTQDEMKQMQFN